MRLEISTEIESKMDFSSEIKTAELIMRRIDARPIPDKLVFNTGIRNQPKALRQKPLPRKKKSDIEALLQFIDQANLIRRDPAEGIDRLEVFDKYSEVYSAGDSDAQRRAKANEVVVSTFNEVYQDVDPAIRSKLTELSLEILQKKNPEKKAEDLIIPSIFYTLTTLVPEIQGIRSDLISIATHFAQLRNSSSADLRHTLRRPLLQADLDIDGTTIHLRLTGLASALDGVDGDRIRICKICENIFWAKRKASEACSPKCANIRLQHKYRDTHKEKINEARRINYQQNKKVKNMRANKNGAI